MKHKYETCHTGDRPYCQSGVAAVVEYRVYWAVPFGPVNQGERHVSDPVDEWVDEVDESTRCRREGELKDTEDSR